MVPEVLSSPMGAQELCRHFETVKMVPGYLRLCKYLDSYNTGCKLNKLEARTVRDSKQKDYGVNVGRVLSYKAAGKDKKRV